MARFNKKPSPKGPRRERPSLSSAPPVDFTPMMAFLIERVGADHPICSAAREGNLSAFMAAIRESGDTQLDHEIASELERMATPLQQVV